MKQRKKDRAVQRGGDLIESAFGISQGDEAHILAILRDKLYSDKILAVLREYATNAVDAHVEVGKGNRPIEVWLPTRLAPELVIRDFGPGLSEDEVRNLYVMYGASTKRNTNEATGQLGLGCKCGFAYTDQFQIVSYYEGKKKLFNAYIDETNVGKVALMHTEDSDEEDGIEIHVAVDPNDVARFQRTAGHLFTFFEVTPIIHRQQQECVIGEYKYWLRGELDNGVHWGMQDVDNNPVAIMGNIPYAIDRRQFDLDDQGSFILQRGVHIWFRIGDLQMAANREALEYTPITKKHIRLVMKDVVSKVGKEVTKKISSANSFKEACLHYAKMKSEQLFKIFGKTDAAATWKGEKVSDRILQTKKPGNQYNPNTRQYEDIEPDTKVQQLGLNRSYRSKTREYTLSQHFVDSVPASDNVVILEMDTTTKWKIKVEYFLDQQAQADPTIRNSYYGNERYYIVAFKDDAEREKMWKKWHLDEWDVRKVSGLADPPSTFTAGGTTMTKKEKKKHTSKMLKLKANFKGKPARKSDNWENVDIEVDDTTQTFHYIEIDHFFPVLWGKKQDYYKLREVVQMFAAIGIDNTVRDIYGLKPAAVKKLKDKPNWKSLCDVVKQAALDVKPDLVAAIAKSESIRQAPYALRTYSERIDDFPEGSPIRELLKFYASLESGSTISDSQDELIGLLRMMGEDVKREAAKELDRLLDAVRGRYPLLDAFRIFPDGYHRYVDEDQIDSIVQYVGIMEEKHTEEAEDDF